MIYASIQTTLKLFLFIDLIIVVFIVSYLYLKSVIT